MPEQINLSDALDLIMQSKTDIKSSVQGKGSEIGDDLTQYAQSIDNIQFRSLQFKNNDTGDMQTSFDVSRYNDSANVSVQQYINGETSYPVNTSYTVSGTSISVTKNTPGTNKQVYRCVPNDYGTTILTIEDTVGNVEYPITLHVPAFTIYGDYSTMHGFDSFEWDENIPVEGGGDFATGWNAAWDTSVQQYPNFTATFSFNDGNGHNVDTANLSFDITGDVIDAGLVGVTYVVTSSSVTFTFTPYYNNEGALYDYYNGEILIAMSDGTSLGDIAPIYLTGGSDIPDEPTYYIYAGNITHAYVTFDDGIGIAEGQTETITVTPDAGYVLNTLVVEGDTTGDTISTTDLGNGEYSFIMPAEDVNIHVDCILDEQSETLAMEISNPSGSPYSMDYDDEQSIPIMDMPITVDEMTLGVSNENGYTSLVDMVGTMGFPLPQEAYEYLAPTSISGNDHCSLSWDNSVPGFYVTSSDTSQWSDDITVEIELNDQNSSCTILGDEWSGNYSSFEEYVATLPESIQPYVTNNAENRPEIPLSVWNGCTATMVFTVDYAGGT